jgi:serine protease Do
MTQFPGLTNPHAASLGSELSIIALALQRCTVQVCSSRYSGGSGIIWHRDGLIVTNAHVASCARVIVKLADGRSYDAVRVAVDGERDLAALQVEAQDLPAAVIGDSKALRVGELVLALGNPQGVFGALSSGIFTGLSSTDANSSQRWVVAALRLAPGNSGGLLANARGQVVGVNTMIAGGLAWAIPSAEVEGFLKRGFTETRYSL